MESKRYIITTYKKDGSPKRVFIEIGTAIELKKKYPGAKSRLQEQQGGDLKI